MTPRIHKLGYFSSPDRGLAYCIMFWAKIREKFPDAELHVFYGWETFDSAFAGNAERQTWKKKMVEGLQQPGIFFHGRVGKETLKEWQQNIGIWMYPTNFTEINCITALDCQANGCVPCVINLAALKETVQSGYKINGDIADPETQERYLAALLELMGNEKVWLEEQERGKKFTDGLSWENIATKWAEQFI